MRRYFLLLILPIIFASCAIHSGMMTGNASLGDNNFEMIGVAMGQSKATYIFFVGGLNRRALILQAKRNMYSLFPLKKGQAYANVSVDTQWLNLLLFQQNTCTITADIVQYGDVDPGKGNQLIFGDMQSLPADSLLDSSLFPFPRNKDVSILTKNNELRPGKVVEIWAFQRNPTYVILFNDSLQPRSAEVKERNIYLTGRGDSLPTHNLHPGNVVKGSLKVPDAPSGVVQAIGTEYILVHPAARAGLQKVKLLDITLAD